MRKLTIPIIVTISLGILMGCSVWDSIFLQAEKVNPSDLDSYEGSLPATQDQAMGAVGNAAFGSVFYGVSAVTSEDQFQAMSVSAARLAPVLTRLGAALRGSAAATRAISYTDASDDNTVDIEISVTDEVYDGPEGGTLTVEKLTLDLLATVDNPNNPSKMHADAKADLDAGMLDLRDPMGGGAYVINNGIIRVKAKGNGDVRYEGYEPSSVSYYAAVDLWAGFSITSTEAGGSGKFILEFNFVESGDYTQAELEDFAMSEDPSALLEGVDLMLRLSVYDNDNKLVVRYEFDEQDLLDAYGEMM